VKIKTAIAAARFSVICLTPALITTAASAAYTLEPQLATGNSFINPTIDGNFTVNFALTSDAVGPAQDRHNSVVFRVAFSRPGVIITGFTWGAPYTTGADAFPTTGSLPLAVMPTTYILPIGDIGENDIEFSNVIPTPTGRFGVGTILSLNLRLPADYEVGQLFVSAVPDTFADGFTEIPSVAGLRLLMVVVPAPSASAGLVLAGALAFRRKRR